jgi:hypothetical protein
MASKEKRQRRIDELMQELDRATVEIRADMAARTAAQMLYDDAVIAGIIAGDSIGEAVARANELYPSEAVELTSYNAEILEGHYQTLKRMSFFDAVRGLTAAPPQAEPSR